MKTKTAIKAEKQFARLLKAISRKNSDALNKLYDIYGKLIYVTALSVSESYFLAEEIVDDVLIKIWNTPPRTAIENPRGWLYVVTANCAKDRLRQEKESVALGEIAVNDSGINKLESDEAFYNKIRFLNEEEQQIMILKFVADMVFGDIAIELDKSLSTVSSTYYRALEKIKKQNF